MLFNTCQGNPFTLVHMLVEVVGFIFTGKGKYMEKQKHHMAILHMFMLGGGVIFLSDRRHCKNY